MAEVTKIPSKAQTMKYEGNLPADVEIFDPGSMASLFKPEFVFIYEEPNTQRKIGFIYRQYGPGDDLLLYDKALLERDEKASRSVVKQETLKKIREGVDNVSTEDLIKVFELNRLDSDIRDKTLQICCVKPILTEESIKGLSDDCKNQLFDEIMKGVRSNKQLVSEFQEKDSKPKA